MPRRLTWFAALSLTVFLVACDQSGGDGHAHGPDTHTHASEEQTPTAPKATSHGSHAHADGTWHAGPDDAGTVATPPAGTHTHADGSVHAAHASAEATDSHAETAIGTATIADMRIELAQGHGAIAAGKESHLVVKLPTNDHGATQVRAWLGTEDRTLSFVGRGDYSAQRGVYDIHAMAPDPLPENARWWIEIEKPDGTKVVGSAEPITH